MSKYEILYHNWTKLKPVKFVFVTTLWSIGFTIPFLLVFEIFKITDNAIGGPDFNGKGIFEIIFLGVIIAPIIETAIFQALPIYLIQRFIKWKTNIMAVLISSFLFSLAHLEYSVWYSFIVIPLGVLLSQAYIVFQVRTESSFWMTCSVHACRNLFALTFSLGELLK